MNENLNFILTFRTVNIHFVIILIWYNQSKLKKLFYFYFSGKRLSYLLKIKVCRKYSWKVSVSWLNWKLNLIICFQFNDLQDEVFSCFIFLYFLVTFYHNFLWWIFFIIIECSTNKEVLSAMTRTCIQYHGSSSFMDDAFITLI